MLAARQVTHAVAPSAAERAPGHTIPPIGGEEAADA
jgi:hypothetical protein